MVFTPTPIGELRLSFFLYLFAPFIRQETWIERRKTQELELIMHYELTLKKSKLLAFGNKNKLYCTFLTAIL